jgi:FtsP/CotA-like multicopper oxidase with cupredoxin domain
MMKAKFRLVTGLVLAVALAAVTSPDLRAAAAAAAKAAAAAAAPQGKAKAGAANQATTTDAAGRKHVVMKRVTPADRKAAAARVRAAAAAAAAQAKTAGAPATMAPAPATTFATMSALAAPQAGLMSVYPVVAGSLIPPGTAGSQYLIGSNGQLIPDYSGLVANWAYSPTPTLTTIGTPTTVGNPLVDRANASDYPVGVGQVAPVLVVVNSPLPAGTLTNFQTWNQATAGASPFASAGNVLHAYLLRPTVNLNEYSVVYDSGAVTVPAPGTPGVSEVFSIDVTAANITVNAGDMIAFYGQGVPVDIVASGTDTLSYPANTAPVQGATISVGGAAFPVYPQARTYSFAATVTVGTSQLGGGIRKFVDTLPGLNAPNNLGQMIPIAVPDTTTYKCSNMPNPAANCVDADYYEIELVEFSERMHSDLLPTRLRGYRQTNMGGTAVHYLGPLIIAQKGRPVRIKFTNSLPTGAAGNLFLPVDASVMGSGPGPNVSNATRAATQPNDLCKPTAQGTVPPGCYTQNRATIHLHGGVTPWISDGTTHQWISPAGTTEYPKGVSVYNVPDMPNPGPAPATPSDGVETFYYTNDQSARLMFYHDHAAGITRLNVYAGEAAGYLLSDSTEAELVAKGVIPADQIPLVIQDKTFVDPANIRVQDPTWNWGTGAATTYTDSTGKTMPLLTPMLGDLWWPHVYQPAQNPYDLSGYNATGRWNYGPWFYPPTVGIPYGPVDNAYCGVVGGPCTNPAQPVKVPGTPNPSWGAEAFLDTPVINGTLYPSLTVQPKAYRLRVLNAAHDRFWNLQLYTAADKNTPTTAGATGAVLCDQSYTGDRANCTEVKMVPAATAPGIPANWPQDGRAGGAPDPATMGPSFIQIGTEGGFLPKPVVVPNQPVLWNNDPLTFNFGNVSDHALLLGPAERADVIVDFSQYAGKTLILYNDAPAAFPALDPRNDYYTGNPDQFDTGGTGSTLPGYGPNIRTIMQIKVEGAAAPAFDVAALMTAWAPGGTAGSPFTWSPAGVFEHAQDPIIVGQAAYDAVYTANPAFRSDPPFGLGTIFDSHVSFETVQGTNVTILAEAKAIHDEMGATFDDYGRMRASLGVAMPNPTPNTANFIMEAYADPATEVLKISSIATLIGDPLADGTQIWRINHNGVDTHPIHFHLFHVQVINRVGWDGAYRLPDETELGWKDTVRVSPLEDTYVALRPIAPLPSILPFKVPNSFRPHEPAYPANASWQAIDPLGNAVTITNDTVNFGWEYVWHCHILSHEENDMMRPVVFTAPPEAPTALAFAGPRTVAAVTLNWRDNSVSATSFRIQRATDSAFTAGLTTFNVPVTQCVNQAGCARSYIDTTAAATTAYFYRVLASNTVGSAVPNYPAITLDTAWVSVAVPAVPRTPVATPTNLAATIAVGPNRIIVTWTDASNNENNFQVWRSVNGAAFAQVGTVTRTNAQRTATGGTVTFTNTGVVVGSTYRYYVIAVNTVAPGGQSAPSTTITVPFAAPAAPNGLAFTVARNGGQDLVTLTWTDASNNEASFQVQRATNAAFTAGVNNTTVAANVTTLAQNVARRTTFYYRVRSVNAVGNSGWSNVVIVVTP